jgi:hypothetical protein
MNHALLYPPFELKAELYIFIITLKLFLIML